MPEEENKEELTAEEIAAAEVAKAEEVVEEVKEKTWSELGLNERYDIMSREQIAGDVKTRNTAFGNLTNDNEKLRSRVAELEAKENKVREAADLPAEVKAEVKKMSAQELERFLVDFQTDPDEALEKRFGERFGRRTDDDLEKFVTERIDEALSGYHGFAQDQAAMADPDYQAADPYIRQLQGEEHFGNTRPATELLDLWRLAMTDKPSADAVYDTMKRFPGVPMKDCVHMVNGRPKSKVDAEKIRKEVKSLAGGGLPSGSSKVSQTEEVGDVYDAFHPDEE